ncbi:predicted protein [Chaetomium globosum CBS 148.51]|uniref:Uncharacterized protein n=1 Tax=Chaetomium globosum (strain ATCC 6205 / CBS 148.51 / DSM 1962 / NBRC 6347 / NRRL 1970) TaxID=306901 RepID=Q2H245_CHAGB|nr:uncharacterized protein CHGG_04151 [Chaetomium globosum CBS 148.51]EAQ87532.1 predicted protein [Chaetomium globosum CBS 148.51]
MKLRGPQPKPGDCRRRLGMGMNRESGRDRLSRNYIDFTPFPPATTPSPLFLLPQPLRNLHMTPKTGNLPWSPPLISRRLEHIRTTTQ